MVRVHSPSHVNPGWKVTIDGREERFRDLDSAADFLLDWRHRETLRVVLHRVGVACPDGEAVDLEKVAAHVAALEKREARSAMLDISDRLKALGVRMDSSGPLADVIVESVAAYVERRAVAAARARAGEIWTDVARRIFPPGTDVVFESNQSRGSTLRRTVESDVNPYFDDEDVTVDLVGDGRALVRILRPAPADPLPDDVALLAEIDDLKLNLASANARVAELESGAGDRGVMMTPETLADPNRWIVHEHEEALRLGGFVGVPCTILRIAASHDAGGLPASFMCSLEVRSSTGGQTMTWGPHQIMAHDLPDARRGALKWAASIIGNVARDLNLNIAESEK